MTMLHVFHNDEEWVIAADEADAWAVWEEHTGEKRADYHSEIEWTQWADDRPLEMWIEGPGGEPPETQKKTCAEWAAERGRCYLGSVDY